jgi:hypothetical protein
MFESHSSISSDSPGEGVGLEGFMMVASVVSNGGRPLKVVDPSAACQEKNRLTDSKLRCNQHDSERTEVKAARWEKIRHKAIFGPI